MTAWLVAALGAVTLVLQGALFRRSLWSLESTEFGVGLFLSSWLIWHAVGAGLHGRWRHRVGRESGPSAFPLALTAFLPVYLLHDLLLGHARELLGVPTYLQFPLVRMTGALLLLNAPVGVLGGWLFPAACRWAAQRDEWRAERVYQWEAAGAAAGGVLFSLALMAHVPAEILALGGAAAVAGLGGVAWRGSGGWVTGLLTLLLLGALGGWGGYYYAGEVSQRQWARLVSGGVLEGSFHTHGAKVLYGRQAGTFVAVSRSHILCVLPETGVAEAVAAGHRVQHPQARTVGVIDDSGYALCRALLAQGMERVWWVASDPAFARALHAHIPPPWRIESTRFTVVEATPLAALEAMAWRVELLIVQLEPISGAIASQALTPRFLSGARRLLGPDGVLSLRLAGGAQTVSEEAARAGAAVEALLATRWPGQLMKPGQETWCMASGGRTLTYDATLLSARGRELGWSEGLVGEVTRMYANDRVQSQRAAYAGAHRAPARGGLGAPRVARRAAFGRALEVEWPQGGITRRCERWGRGLPWGWACVALLLWSLGARAVWRGAVPGLGSVGLWLACGGAFSVLMQLILLNQLQARFGSVYRDFALASSLYMLGLAWGVRWIAQRTRERGPGMAARVTWIHLGGSGALLLLGLLLPYAGWPVIFLTLGALSGGYVPLAVAMVSYAAGDAAAAGRLLVSTECAGAALGGLLGGVVALPLLGSIGTLLPAGLALAASSLLWAGWLSVRRGRRGLAGVLWRIGGLGALLAGVGFALAWRDRGPAGGPAGQGRGPTGGGLVPRGAAESGLPAGWGASNAWSTATRQRPAVGGDPPATDQLLHAEAGVVEDFVVIDEGPAPAAPPPPPVGRPRRVDLKRLNARIAEGTLSDREAMYYVPEERE